MKEQPLVNRALTILARILVFAWTLNPKRDTLVCARMATPERTAELRARNVCQERAVLAVARKQKTVPSATARFTRLVQDASIPNIIQTTLWPLRMEAMQLMTNSKLNAAPNSASRQTTWKMAFFCTQWKMKRPTAISLPLF
uniref:(northern house mosquito) hypothetical protein n=1 Tax=Culex pipiens TaxID=7175 RepID=A0A8D8ES75_CULPI